MEVILIAKGDKHKKSLCIEIVLYLTAQFLVILREPEPILTSKRIHMKERQIQWKIHAIHLHQRKLK